MSSGTIRRGVTPATNAVAAIMLLITLSILVLGQFLVWRNARKTGQRGSGASVAGIDHGAVRLGRRAPLATVPPLDNVDSWRGPTASQAAGLTLEAARTIIDAVQAVGRELGVAMSCAVVDSGDQLVAFERMDAADLVGITLARDKAFTALVNRMPTRDLAPIVQPGTEFYGYESVAGWPNDRLRWRDAAGTQRGAGWRGRGQRRRRGPGSARGGRGRRSLRGLGPRIDARLEGAAGSGARPGSRARRIRWAWRVRARAAKPQATGTGSGSPASEARSAALSVRSQGRSRSGRPKWP